MSKETFQDATVEAALEQAAEKLGVAAADLEHEVIDEKRDFWGTGDDTVTIEAWARAPEPELEPEPEPELEPEPAAVPVAGREPGGEDGAPDPAAELAEDDRGETVPTATGGGFWSDDNDDSVEAAETESTEAAVEGPAAEVATDSEEQAGPAASEVVADGEEVEPAAIAGLLDQIFHDMEFDCTVEIEPQPDGFLATVSGDDKEALLEGNGRGLSALELNANNAFRHRLPPGNKVRVDAGDFRSRRDEELADLAFQVAHSAKESGRTQETQPLNPYERRLVHLALAEDAAVTTVSRGSGFLKNVQVVPQRGGGGSPGGRGRGRRR